MASLLRPPAHPVRTRIAAWLWIGCLQFFLAEAVSTQGFIGHYSYRLSYISDLGAVHCTAGLCSHWHLLMDASFLLQAVLIASGALLLPLRYSPGWLGISARVLLLLAAFGVYDVAIAPEDVDINKHIFGAGLNFFAAALAMLFWSIALALHGRRRPPPRARSRQAWIAFGAALIAALVAGIGVRLLYRPIGPVNAFLGAGTVERLAAYPLPLWLAWTGWSVLRAHRKLQRDTVRYIQQDA
jgi:hypothetical membrane protein